MSGKIVTLHVVARSERSEDLIELAVRVALKQGLRRRGWTLEHAARECGTTPASIGRYLRGERRIPARVLWVVLELGAANDGRKAA